MLCLGHLIGYLTSRQGLIVEDMETDDSGMDLNLETAIKDAVFKIGKLFLSDNIQIIHLLG